MTTDDDSATVPLAAAGQPIPDPAGAREFRRRRRRARWRRIRPFLVALLGAAVVGAAFWAVFFSSWLAIEHVRIDGTHTLRAKQVRSMAAVPTGTPMARLDPGRIRARVETIPEVKEATVHRSWPRTVRITVTERDPLAVVDYGEGLRSVDEDGVLFGSHRSVPADLPLIRTGADIGAEALAEAARVVGSLDDRLRTRVEVVDAESVDRIRLRLTGPARTTVLWGSAEASAQKAEVLAALLAGAGAEAATIDVSVPGRPTTR